MGEVYLAQDTKLDRKVALKTLPADLAAKHDRMRRFVRIDRLCEIVVTLKEKQS
jgi:serine/threonine protein kinase